MAEIARIKELEIQYSPSQWSRRFPPDQVIEEHVHITTEASNTVKEIIPNQLDVKYGEMDREKLDIFGLETLPLDAPIIMYVHGGYWQELSKTNSSYCVKPLYEAGFVVIIAGYELAPKVTLDVIVQQIEKACKYAIDLARKRGSTGLYLCGHSAGAHLLAMQLHSKWLTDSPQEASLIKGCFLVSGLYDLRDLLPTYVNNALKMSSEDAVRNSPSLLMSNLSPSIQHVGITVYVGEFDSPTFIKQSQQYEQCLRAANIKSNFKIITGRDHFDIVEKLQDSHFEITKAMIQCINRQNI